MKNIYLTKKLGFTLVELIIYIAVFSVLMTSVVGIAINSDKLNKSALQQQTIQNIKMYLTSHIQEAFNNSHRIDVPSESNSGIANELKLAQINYSDGTVIQYFDYQLVSNQILFYSGLSVPVTCDLTQCKPLTDPGYIKISSMTFNLIKNVSGRNIGVRVNIGMNGIYSDSVPGNMQTEFTLQ